MLDYDQLCGFIWSLWLCCESEPQITVNINKPLVFTSVSCFCPLVLMYFLATQRKVTPFRFFLSPFWGGGGQTKIPKFNLTLIMLFVIFCFKPLLCIYIFLVPPCHMCHYTKEHTHTQSHTRWEFKKEKFLAGCQLWTQSHSHRFI